jgi:RHS repeat-associated protein
LTSGPGGTYEYNDLGERTEQTSGDTTTDYGWDQAGNLTTNTGGSSDLDLSYGYDGNGLLQSTTSGDTTTQLTWDPNATVPLLIVDGTTNIIYGPDDLPLEQIGSDDDPIYYHHDQLGSTRLLTNADGDSVETINYSDYGTPTITSGSVTTNLLYAGQYTDPNNGLVYMRARWYDPATGQFLSVDPLEAQTGATYNYADDNPSDNADPSGLCSVNPGSWLDDINPFSSQNCAYQAVTAVLGGISVSPSELSAIAAGLAVAATLIPGGQPFAVALTAISAATAADAAGQDAGSGNWFAAVLDAVSGVAGADAAGESVDELLDNYEARRKLAFLLGGLGYGALEADLVDGFFSGGAPGGGVSCGSS